MAEEPANYKSMFQRGQEASNKRREGSTKDEGIARPLSQQPFDFKAFIEEEQNLSEIKHCATTDKQLGRLLRNKNKKSTG